MIGVCASEADRPAVQEFFELFKTPWEFYREGGAYEVLLCGDGAEVPTTAPLVILSGASSRPLDPPGAKVSNPASVPILLHCGGGLLPLYGPCCTFQTGEVSLASIATTQGVAAYRAAVPSGGLVRLGYDLFAEVHHVLAMGQPAAQAPVPVLDRHIGVIREAILGSGLPLVEIPPSPCGHPFIACLSHDVDHVGIRNHKGDHTMFGFLLRATAGSAVNWLRGRLTFRQMLTNWVAAASLPLVHLGLVRDFWYQFDRYLEIEQGRRSTYFVIPWPGEAGHAGLGPAPSSRAASYDAATLTPYFDRLRTAGCEIGLHGINAWRDPARGREEAATIAALTGATELGVRMHWLYFDAESPLRLEEAGFSYDSTVGYNEAIGYRAGTSQVYRPFGATSLLELPLHVMDTALFYPSRMNLAPPAARAAVTALIDHSSRSGGVLTVNWHDRSLAPERLWDGFYIELMNNLETRGAWFATASEAVAWFRLRRGTVFEDVDWGPEGVRVTASAGSRPGLPGLLLRVHPPRKPGGHPPAGVPEVPAWIDVPLARDTHVPLPV
jgi:hypothetical protein